MYGSFICVIENIHWNKIVWNFLFTHSRCQLNKKIISLKWMGFGGYNNDMYTCEMIIKSLNLFMFIMDKLNSILWYSTNVYILLDVNICWGWNCVGIRENCVLISINVCSIESIQWSVSRLSNALFNIRSKHTYINCQNHKKYILYQ